MRDLKHFWLGIVLLTSLVSLSQSTSIESPPDVVIRRMYDRLTFFTELGPVAKAAVRFRRAKVDSSTLEQQVKAAKVEFELGDFHVGPYQELLSKQWGDVITVITPPIKYLRFSQKGMNYSGPAGNGSWNTLEANWQPSGPSTPLDLIFFRHTVGELFQSYPKDILGSHVKDNFTGYVSYHVVAKYGGEEQSYNAVMLITKDPSGTTIYTPIEPVTQLLVMETASEYPTGLLNTDLRKVTTTDGVPFVEKFFRDREVRGGTCKHGAMCLGSQSYGIATEDLNETH